MHSKHFQSIAKLTYKIKSFMLSARAAHGNENTHGSSSITKFMWTDNVMTYYHIYATTISIFVCFIL